MSRSLPQDSDLIGVRCSQAWVFFKISPGDSNVLPELRTNDLKFLPDITHWKVELPGFPGSWGIECLLAILLLSSFVSLAGSIIKQVHWAGIPRVFVDSWVFNTSQLERPGGPGLWERERIGSSLPPLPLTQGLWVYPGVLCCGVLVRLKKEVEGRILGINLLGKLRTRREQGLKVTNNHSFTAL